jgi:hypothetical protein
LASALALSFAFKRLAGLGCAVTRPAVTPLAASKLTAMISACFGFDLLDFSSTAEIAVSGLAGCSARGGFSAWAGSLVLVGLGDAGGVSIGA